MSKLKLTISKNINIKKDKYIVVNIPFNFLKKFITNTKPIINNNDTFTILWDSISSETIECKSGTIINWILLNYNLYLVYSKLFLDNCIFDDNLFISNKQNDIFTILIEPGTYIFSTTSIDCSKKNITFIVK